MAMGDVIDMDEWALDRLPHPAWFYRWCQAVADEAYEMTADLHGNSGVALDHYCEAAFGVPLAIMDRVAAGDSDVVDYVLSSVVMTVAAGHLLEKHGHRLGAEFESAIFSDVEGLYEE